MREVHEHRAVGRVADQAGVLALEPLGQAPEGLELVLRLHRVLARYVVDVGGDPGQAQALAAQPLEEGGQVPGQEAPAAQAEIEVHVHGQAPGAAGRGQGRGLAQVVEGGDRAQAHRFLGRLGQDGGEQVDGGLDAAGAQGPGLVHGQHAQAGGAAGQGRLGHRHRPVAVGVLLDHGHEPGRVFQAGEGPGRVGAHRAEVHLDPLEHGPL